MINPKLRSISIFLFPCCPAAYIIACIRSRDCICVWVWQSPKAWGEYIEIQRCINLFCCINIIFSESDSFYQCRVRDDVYVLCSPTYTTHYRVDNVALLQQTIKQEHSFKSTKIRILRWLASPFNDTQTKRNKRSQHSQEHQPRGKGIHDEELS